ncbi:DUF4127 family protein [Bifidobacterium sp. 82T10]|uniref:DUF4127 family protein n=1 Tax=Bifidobacterium miconis TaxID=2834435 RepID=A0ABS6WDD2_9BIFI|nr:DUF4127 family protein [Bifidobacterium miconis]MBW3092064.1 DUF4127 family protein [Bifidobacterium miconis]
MVTCVFLLPLDERPCNARYPEMIARSGGIDLVGPSASMLGSKKTPADAERIESLLLEQAANCDVAVVSIDMLVYGGLVPSRIHHIGLDSLIRRLSVLRRLKRINPNLLVFASATVMRAPSYDSDDEEPNYYARYGSDLFRRAYLLDMNRRNGLDKDRRVELDRLEAGRIPESVIRDYEDRRALNLTVNEACLDLVKDGVVDYLVFPQDDSSPYGYTAVAQRRLRAAIETRFGSVPRGRRLVTSYPGSDEVGLTLLSRAVCALRQRTPLIRAHYSSKRGPQIIPLYEDRPMADTLRAHIQACGGLLCEDDEPDIELMVNSPNATMREASESEPHNDRELTAFENAISRYERDGRAVAVCDAAYANGGDPQLVRDLDTQGSLARLSSYAGWNTHGNTLGTALAQAIIADGAHVKADGRNLARRVIEDLLYQTEIRWLAEREAERHGGDYSDVTSCEPIMGEYVRRSLQQAYDRLHLSRDLPYAIRNVRFPWHRLFEVDFDLVLRNGNAESGKRTATAMPAAQNAGDAKGAWNEREYDE